MKSILANSGCIILILSIQTVFSQVEFTEVKAKINVENVEDVLSITGTVENLKSEYKNISFKLAVLKSNKSGSNKANNSQDGRVTLESLQKVPLSTTQINATKDDQVTIVLFIYDEKDVVIGKDRVEIGSQVEPEKVSVRPNDGLEMVGIISNDTKTKLGNDYYDLFYAEYNKLKISSSKIISIEEELTFGRTTKIMVSIEGEIIEEFNARPDDDFLQYMAEESASKVFKYFKKLESQEKSIFQY
jgi:hypothetical protein